MEMALATRQEERGTDIQGQNPCQGLANKPHGSGFWACHHYDKGCRADRNGRLGLSVVGIPTLHLPPPIIPGPSLSSLFLSKTARMAPTTSPPHSTSCGQSLF